MGYGRRKYKAHTKGASTFTLNITSMTDMFTILLVFLLQTYSTSEVQIIPEKGISLPLSNADANPVLAVKISVSPNEMRIEDKVIMTLNAGHFQTKDIDGRDKNFLPALFEQLRAVSESKKSKETDEGKILIQADSSLPYDVLRKVMYTASMAGFPKMKFATVMGE